jgi:hypothetical protein
MWSQLESATSTQFRILLFILILASCSTAFPQQVPDHKADKDWEQICKHAEAEPLTAIQPSGPLSGDQLTKCDETALYYGIGEKPDYAAALQCGWFQRAHPQETVGNMFYGPGVLTMLYANGKGVPRNYDFAIRFACENSWVAEAEMAYRIGHLEHLRDAGPQSAMFDLCDDITSGLSDGTCTSIQTRTADTVRARKIEEILDRFPAAVKSAFAPLQAAELEFEKARTQGEVDLSGTSRAALQLSEEAKLRDQFLISLQRFGRGDIPDASEPDLSLLEQKLNEICEQIQHSPASKWEFGTIKPEGIHDTERKWISLVDAWIGFARIAYPNLSTTRVRAQLIRLRLHQLRSLYGE